MMSLYPSGYFDAAMAVYEVQQDAEARLNRIKRAREAYNGNWPVPLKALTSGVHDNVALNYVKLIVDTGADYLFGGGGVTLHTDPDGSDRTPDEEYLDSVFARNGGATMLLKLALNGGLCGDVFVKIVRTSRVTAPLPRLLVVDPAIVTVLYESDDIDDVYGYRLEWRDFDRRTGKPINRRQMIERRDNGTAWDIVDYVQMPGSAKWVQDGPSEFWPYPFAPMVHCHNLPAPSEPYGYSDLDGGMIEMNDAINKTWSNLLRIMGIYAHPLFYGVGGVPGQIDRSPEKMPILPMGAELRMLQAQGVDESSINVYLRLREAMHEIARLPEVATGKLESVGSLSGIALKVLYGPLIAQTQRKQQTYGALLAELARRVLIIDGRGDMPITVTWPEIVPGDALSERQVALIDQQLGVSTDTILEALGFDAEAERMKRDQEDTTDGEEDVPEDGQEDETPEA